MPVSLKLPPSGRDFLVYQRLVVDGASTRTVAEEVRISQTRVRQIVLRVMQWLVETLPADTELSEAAKLCLGQHIAADRLERFYVEANRAWTETTQPKFASLCLRVIAAQAKIPALPGTLEALAMDAIYGPLPDDESEQVEHRGNCEANRSNGDRRTNQSTPDARPSAVDVRPAPSAPPVRDCSPGPSVRPITAAKPSAVTVVKPIDKEPCDQPSPAAHAARSAFLAPAHLPATSGDDLHVTELKITPSQLGFTTKKHLTRRERRRLRRVAMAK
jgi:hypothetical protein